MFKWLKNKLFPKKKALVNKELVKKVFKEPKEKEETDTFELTEEEIEEFSGPEAQAELAKSLWKREEDTIEDLIDQIEVIDLRHEQPDPPPLINGKKKWRIRNGTVSKRDPKKVKGIVVHQTAARFGVSERQIAASGGDKRLALARRALKISTPVTVFYNDGDPFVVWAFPLEWYSYHGNGFNSDCLGFEMDGDFAGLADDPSTAYRKKDNPDKLDEKMIAAGRRAIKLLVEEGRKAGMPIEYIYAHRQSSPTRRSDPGEDIWRELVLNYAVPELGLKMKPEHIRRKGYNIPKQWDPENGVGDYWDKPKLK